MIHRKRRRKRKQSFMFTSVLPRGRKAKKKARKLLIAQAEKLNNGFESVTETPFDVSTSKQESDIVREMQIQYNVTSDEKRYRTMYERGFISSQDEYNKIMSIYQSPIYQMLKEQGYSDSHQIRDLIQSFGSLITASDIEKALLSVIETLKLQQTYNIQQIREAMDLGFTFDEAVYLTESDRIDEIQPEESLLEIRDRLNALLETRDIRLRLEDELRNERWD